jgi:GH43 family beta-xylosidase
VFVSIGSRNHHFEEGHVFNVFKFLDLVIPWHPCFSLLQIKVIIKHSECTWELSRFETVFNEGVEVVFATFIKCTTHSPSITKSENCVDILFTEFRINLVETRSWI